MSHITRTKEPLDPSIATADEGSQDPADARGAPARRPGRRGNQNARTHGAYSRATDPVDAAQRLHRQARQQLAARDIPALYRTARALQATGDAASARALRIAARMMEDARAQTHGLTPAKRRTPPPLPPPDDS